MAATCWASASFSRDRQRRAAAGAGADAVAAAEGLDRLGGPVDLGLGLGQPGPRRPPDGVGPRLGAGGQLLPDVLGLRGRASAASWRAASARAARSAARSPVGLAGQLVEHLGLRQQVARRRVQVGQLVGLARRWRRRARPARGSAVPIVAMALVSASPTVPAARTSRHSIVPISSSRISRLSSWAGVSGAGGARRGAAL